MWLTLIKADLKQANLSRADFSGADFSGSHLTAADLREANVEKSHHSNTVFADSDLSDWEIESAKLHRAGLSNQAINDIVYKLFDLRATQAIQISPLFISYNHEHGPFIDNLEPEFNKRGIRFWRDIHHTTAGRLEKQVDRAIRYNPTVLLVLSEHSTKSDWVQHEVRTARKLEIETGRDVLCPVSLLFCSTCAKRCRPKKRGDVPFSR